MMGEKTRRQVSGWLFHMVVWAILLALPFFSILPGRPIMDGKGYLHFLVMILSFMAVFYANWFFLIRKYLSERKIGPFLWWNILVVAVVMVLTHVIYRFVLPAPDNIPPQVTMGWGWLQTLRWLVGNAFLYTMVVMMCVAVKMTGQWYRAETLRKDLEKARTEAELQNLKSQLNPHFLFNTLNNIYSLIQIDGDRAQAAVHDLGDMLRYVLYDSAEDSVPLAKELDFLRDYIALMKIRLPRHVDLQVDFPDTVSSREVAPMLFISPIENAFKHGVSQDQPSWIHIVLREEADKAVCDIRNSNFPKADDDRSGSGIGLRNLEQRLEMIYPRKYVFTHGAEGEAYHTYLEVPL